MLKVDLHSHTDRSPDAATPPRILLERALEAGLDRIAVTDHGTIEGALEARELEPRRVIVGEEVKCACGTELIGLFLSERIPQRLPIDEVVERIRDQGAVVYAPHPFAYPWRPLWRAGRALAVAEVAEAFNSRAFFRPWNAAAERAAYRRGLAVAAGSDAHFPAEVGRAYTEMAGFAGAEEFREAIRGARPVAVGLTGAAGHLKSTGLKLVRRTAAVRPLGFPVPSPVER